MKIRIDNDTYAQLTLLHRALGFSRAEAVRRCLRWYRNGNISERGVDMQSAKPTPRNASERYEMDLDYLDHGLTPRQILGIIRARMETIDWEQIENAAKTRNAK